MVNDSELIQDLERTLTAAGLAPTLAAGLVGGQKPARDEPSRALGLAIIDVDHIQETLLASPRPVTIYGASHALAAFDGEVHRLPPPLATTVVYAGGGNALLILPLQHAEALERGLRAALERLIPSAECTFCVLPIWCSELALGPKALETKALGANAGAQLKQLGISPGGAQDSGAQGFGALVANLQLKLRQKKGHARVHPFLPKPSTTDRCEECARRPRVQDKRCTACAQLRVLGAKERSAAFAQARTFEELFGLGNRIAYIHIDGRGIGAQVQRCRRLRDFVALSARLRDIFDTMPKALLHEHYRVQGENGEERHMYQLILSGGDDLLLVIPASGPRTDAFTFTRDLLREIDKLGAEGRGADDRIHAGAGVLITKTLAADYSCRRAADHCKHAKAMIDRGSAIHFEHLLSGSPEIHSVAHGQQQGDAAAQRSEFAMTQRPYALGDLDTLVETAHKLTARRLPRAQLQSLRDSFERDPTSARLTLLYQMARTPALRELLLTGAKTPLASVTIPDLWLRPPHDAEPWSTALPDLIEFARMVRA